MKLNECNSPHELNKKRNITCLLDAEKKAFDKSHSLFIIKNSQQTQNKRKIPQSLKGQLPETHS